MKTNLIKGQLYSRSKSTILAAWLLWFILVFISTGILPQCANYFNVGFVEMSEMSEEENKEESKETKEYKIINFAYSYIFRTGNVTERRLNAMILAAWSAPLLDIVTPPPESV